MAEQGVSIMGIGIVEIAMLAGCVGIPLIVGVVALIALLAKGSKHNDGQ